MKNDFGRNEIQFRLRIGERTMQIKNLCKTYKLQSGGEVLALNGVNVNFPNSGLFTIYGKSGAGKTTLLNLLGLIEEPTSGEIIFNGKDIFSNKEKDKDRYRKQASFVFQEYNLIEEYNVYKNVALPLMLENNDNAEIEKKVNEALSKVELSGLGDRKIIELSGGQQQRVVIARALVQNSKVILCDEPTGNLDEETAAGIMKLLKEISKEKLVIVVSHNLELTKKFSDGMVTIGEGEVKEISENLKENKEENNGCENHIEKVKKKTSRLKSGKVLFELGWDNIKKFKFISSFVALLAVFCLSVFTVFCSLSTYSYPKALALSLNANNQNVIQLSKYSDTSEWGKNGQIVVCGVYMREDEVEKEDKEKIRKQIGYNVPLYYSYFYKNMFTDFADIKLPSKEEMSRTRQFIFHQFAFREVITVDDFSTFRQEISYGNTPKEDNEIMIYDYMAENLLYYKVLQCEDVKNVVGQTLTDRVNGANYKICGILKSKYEDYRNIVDEEKDDSDRNYKYVKCYLTSLQCIVAKPVFMDMLDDNTASVIIRGVYRYNELNKENSYELDTESLSKMKFCKAKWYVNENDYLWQREDAKRGIVFTKSQAERLFGIDNLTKESANELFDNIGIDISISFYSETIEETSYMTWGYGIKGIVDDNTMVDGKPIDNENMLYTIGVTEEYYDSDFFTKSLRAIYLGLGNNIDENVRILEKLEAPKPKSFQFYKDNPEYAVFGYTENTPVGILVVESEEFFVGLKNVMQYLSIFSTLLIIPCFMFYVVYSIKKTSYKVGLLKSLGTSNIKIALIFIQLFLLMVAVGVAISIPTSLLLVNMVNMEFAKAINNTALVFFSIDGSMFLWELLFMVGLVIIMSIFTYLVLLLKTPVNLIRQNKNR